jgi:hypothetical protein
MTLEFAVTWDYRCPFGRNAHEHILAGLAGGADWRVRFVPFSLGQVHVADGVPDVWERPEQDAGILALQTGVVVRDRFQDRFPAGHRAMFAVRHDEGRHIEEPGVLRSVLTAADVDPGDVFPALEDGTALAQVRAEHESAVASHGVWGVPTFLAGDRAVFIRLMERPTVGSDATESIRTIERVIRLLTEWPALNEFKHTTVPR